MAFDQIHDAWIQGWPAFAFLASQGRLPPSSSYCFKTQIGFFGIPSPKSPTSSFDEPPVTSPSLSTTAEATTVTSKPILPPSTIATTKHSRDEGTIQAGLSEKQESATWHSEIFDTKKPATTQNSELEMVTADICRQIPAITSNTDWKQRPQSYVDLVKWCSVLCENLTEATAIKGGSLKSLVSCFEKASRKITDDSGDMSMQDCWFMAQLFRSTGLNTFNSIHLVKLGAYNAITNHMRRVANYDRLDVKSILYFVDFLIHSSTIWVKMGKGYNAKQCSVQAYQALAVIIDPDCAISVTVRCRAIMAILCRVSPKACPPFYRMNTAALFQVGNGTLMMKYLCYWEGWNAVNPGMNSQFSDVITEVVRDVTTTVGNFEGKLREQCSVRFNTSMDLAREILEDELDQADEMEQSQSADS